MRTLYELFTRGSFLSIGLMTFIAGLLWVPSFVPGGGSGIALNGDSMLLYGFLDKILSAYPFIEAGFSFVLFLLTAFLLNYLNTRFILVQERTFLPFWFFILGTSFFPGIFNLNPILPASLLILLSLYLVFASYKKQANCLLFFDAGLAIGIASLFYAPALYFVLFLWIANMVLRPFYWREWIHPVLGILSVFIIAWSYYYVFENNIDRFIILLLKNLQPAGLSFEMDYSILAGSAYLLILIVISSFYMVKIFQFRKVYARDLFKVLFWLYIISLTMFFFPSGGNYGLVYIISFPVAYILTNYFVNARKTLGNRLLFFMGVVLMIAVSVIRVFF